MPCVDEHTFFPGFRQSFLSPSIANFNEPLKMPCLSTCLAHVKFRVKRWGTMP